MEAQPDSKKSIADSIRRLLDQRGEDRSASESQTAVMTHDGNRHVVGVANVSASGAMIRYRGNLVEGDEVQLQLLDQGNVTGQVRWIRDGQVGIAFSTRLDAADDDK